MRLLVLIFTAILFSNHNCAQGCSDAGICTLGSLKYNANTIFGDTIKKRFKLGFTQTYGIGENSTAIHNSIFSASAVIGKSTQVFVSVPLQIASGDLGTVAGGGDFTMGFTQKLHQNKNWKFTLNMAGRIPMNNADMTTKAYLIPELDSINKGFSKLVKQAIGQNLPINLDLFKSQIDMTYPMAYQSSRGTYDFIGGLGIEFKSWQLSLGYQLPLTGNNKNETDNSKYLDTIPIDIQLPIQLDLSFNYMYGLQKFNSYFSSRKLLRQPDFMFRLQKNFKVGGRTNLYAGAVGIYHLKNDRIVTPKIPEFPILETAKFILPKDIQKQIDNFFKSIESEKEVIGSQGLTLNINAGGSYMLNSNFKMNFDVGFPIVTRTAQPDGLKRSFVASIGLDFMF